jgi:iron complex outermembrane recepter protein
MKRPTHIAAMLCSMVLAGHAHRVAAQGRTGDTTVVQLDRLPVTVARGTAPIVRLPAAYSIVRAADIRDSQATVGLDESLDRVPGVFVNNRYNFSLGTRISIRGLGARAAFGVRGIRVVSDGIPLTMPDGQSNLNNLELGTAKRVDVLRGPSSSLYGNAAGGVISIETEDSPARLSAEVRTLAGNEGVNGGGLGRFFKTQGKVGGPLAAGGYVASISRTETDGYRDFSRAKFTLLNLVARQAIGPDSRISLIVNGYESPLAQSAGALPADSVARDPRMAWPNNVRTGSGEATRQLQAGVAFAHISETTRFDVSAYGLGRELDNALPFAWIDLSRRGGGTRATFSGSTLRGRIDITGGLDVEWVSDDRQEFDNAGGHRGETMTRDQLDQVLTIAPFVQALVAITPTTDILAGIRYDRSRFSTDDRFMSDGRDDSGNRTLSATSPMVGVTWAARPDLHVYGNVATSFQTPTTTELINAPPPSGETCCPGGFNTALDPQRATSFEIGARGTVGRVSIDVAAYHMNVRRTIVPYQVASVDGREFFRNAGESRHRGIEMGAATSFGSSDVRVAWTLNDFIFLDDGDPTVANEGHELPGVPRSHFFAGIRLRPVRAFRVDLELDHAGGYFASDANDPESRNDAATVLDLRLLLDTRLGPTGFRPFLGVANLTDTHYNSSVVVNAVGRRYYEPAPPRSVQVGLSLSAGGWSAR